MSARLARALKWMGDAPWPLLIAGMTLSFSLFGLAACRALGVEAKIRLREDSFSTIRGPIVGSLGQESTEKWTAQADLQPGQPKSDRLLATANLFLMLRANLRFIGEHGLLALQSGGALQLAGLVLTAYGGMLAFAFAKWFEYRFIDRLSKWTARHAVRPDESSAPVKTPTHSPPCAPPPSPAPPAPAGVRRGRGGRR